MYHRLAVIEIHVPSLNDRKEDIPLLAQYFLAALSPQKELQPDAVKSLQQINWTGNIRQLRNVMERLHILGDHRITAQDVYLHTTSKENS